MNTSETEGTRKVLAPQPMSNPGGKGKREKNSIANKSAVTNSLAILVGDDDAKLLRVTDLVSEIRSNHELVLGGLIKVTANAIRCGSCLLQVKIDLGHGNWQATFDEHLAPLLGFTKRTMQRYIAEYNSFQRFLADAESTAIEGLSELERIALYGEFKRSVQACDKLEESGTLTEDDWLTPIAIVESVRCYFGTAIDTDPCASKFTAIQIATTFYTLADGIDGGLSSDLPWQGNVFIAPGLKTNLTPWVDKAFLQLEGGQMEQGILFAPITLIASIEALLAFPITIVKSELTATRLLNASKSKQLSLPPMGLVLIARKPDVNRLVGCLRDIGVVYAPAN